MGKDNHNENQESRRDLKQIINDVEKELPKVENADQIKDE